MGYTIGDMNNTVKNIDSLLEKEVDIGHHTSISEAEKKLISQLIHRNITRDLELSDQEVEHGHYELVTESTNKKLMEDIAKTGLP